MKRLILYSLIGACFALGCRRVEEPQLPIPQGKGAIQVVLCLQAASKAQDTYPMTMAEFKATIVQDQTVVHTWDPMSSMPAVVYLEPGSYTLKLETRGTRVTVNNIPRYVGQTPFEVVAGRVASIDAQAKIQSLSVSVDFADDIAALNAYKISYFALDAPNKVLFEVTQAQNSPTPKRVYIDNPFPYGVRVEGQLNNLPWRKNVLVYDNLTIGAYHNLILSNR